MQAEVRNVVGADAVVLFPESHLISAGFNPERVREAYEAMVEGESDIILVIGPVSSEVAVRRLEYPKPTVAFGALNRDLVPRSEDRETSGIHNFTYVVSSRSYERDLAAFKKLYDFETLGLVVPAQMLDIIPIVEALDQAVTELGANYELIPYSSPASLDPYLNRIDAVYLAESFSIPPDEIREMASTLIANGIPSFSGTQRQDVEMGFMATNQGHEDLDQMIRRLALNIEAVVYGENLSTRPVLVNLSQTLTINLQTAHAVGVKPRFSLLPTTEFVGSFENLRATRRYALDDLVKEALQASLAVESGRRGVQLANQDIRTAWSSYLPSISTDVTGSIIDPDLAELSGGQNPQYSAQGGFSVSQAFFSPGANAAISIQRSLARARAEEFNTTELDLILDAGGAYFSALIAKANLRIQLGNLDATKRNLRIAKRNFEAGQSGRGDVLRLESEAAKDMQSVAGAYTGFQQSLNAINQILNQPIGREIGIQEASTEGGLPGALGHEEIRQLIDEPMRQSAFEEFLVAEALRNSPELRAFDHSLAATSRSVRLNGLERFLPTVAGGANFTRTIDRWGTGVPDPGLTVDNYYTIGLSASIPLFDSNLRNIDRQSGKIREEQMNLDRAYTASLIERNVRDVVLEVMNQIANMELSAISEDAAAESLELAEVAFANGAINIVELLDAQTNQVRAQLAQASATYTFLATTLTLQRLAGHYFILSSEAENLAFLQRFEAFRATPIR
jgi:outer membrane protein TolC